MLSLCHYSDVFVNTVRFATCVTDYSCDYLLMGISAMDRCILLALPGRAEIADREKHLFFPVPDQAVERPVPVLDRKTARERHADRMARRIEHKHRKCGHQVIEEPVLRGIMKRGSLCMFIPGKAAIRDHRAELFERFAIP